MCGEGCLCLRVMSHGYEGVFVGGATDNAVFTCQGVLDAFHNKMRFTILCVYVCVKIQTSVASGATSILTKPTSPPLSFKYVAKYKVWASLHQHHSNTDTESPKWSDHISSVASSNFM